LGKEYILPVIRSLEELDLPVFYSLWELEILNDWKDYPFKLTSLDVISIVYKEHYNEDYDRDEDIRLLEKYFTKSDIQYHAGFISWTEEELEIWKRNGYDL
jgi:hypothetical protein